MLKLKSQLTCTYCSRILKDPILLPCDDSICCGHLSERKVVKENRIKCGKCKQEFQIKGNQFKSNEALIKLIEDRCYLSEEEISLKKVLEVSMQNFFEFYDEFVQNKSILETDVYDHFQEMRFQIDEHRERLKETSAIIDDIALTMIDESKKYGEMFLKNLNERFQVNFSSFEKNKPLEDELNEIEELFRDPNLQIDAIKEMHHKQEKSLNEFQSKLNEMKQIKDDLKATNLFQPNFSPFNKEEMSLFGSLKLNEFCSYMNSFKSQILKGEIQCIELINLCEFSPNYKWSLLYRATRDGFGAKDFHSKCDGHSNTLTIMKAKQSQFIFGGFTTVKWESSNRWKSDPNAFLFSLTNKDNTPLKMKIDPNQHHGAIYCDSEYGPTFGYCDIHMANISNTTMSFWSNLGYAYKHSQYAYRTNEARIFLAGSHKFKLDEIEVYEKEENLK
jgi:hypothetical protein